MTKNDNRVVPTTLGTADEKLANKLGRTMRDGEHAQLFATHAHEIDILQMDAAQMNQAKKNPDHPLVKQGLLARCFNASDLLDAVAKVEAMAAAVE